MTVNRSTGFIPRKSYFTISPSVLRAKLLTAGIDIKSAAGLSSAFQDLFNKFGIDERLNYDCIEQAILGIHSSRAATLIIATADTKTLGKESADVVCTGTNDDVAINAAINTKMGTTPTGKVLFLDGTYDIKNPIDGGNGRVLRGLTLEGMGASTIFNIAAGQRGFHHGWPDAADQSELTVRGIKFKGGSIAIDTDIDGKYLITECFFEGQTHSGIYMQDANDYIVTDNFFSGVATNAGSAGACVYLNNCGRMVVAGNVIDGGGANQAIHCGNGDLHHITDNIIFDVDGEGIFIWYATSGAIKDNTIVNPGTIGIELGTGAFNSGDIDLVDNYVRGGGDIGIFVHPAGGSIHDTKVSGNRVHDCQKEGMYILSDNALVSDNVIYDNGLAAANTYAGLRLSCTDPYVHGNKIHGLSHKYAIDTASNGALIVMNDCKNGYTTAKINDTGAGTLLNLDGSANDWNRA